MRFDLSCLVAALALAGCSPAAGGSAPEAGLETSGDARPTTTPAYRAPSPTILPGADRIVAVGDVHGDLNATLKALQLGGAIDQQANWTGGALVVVQTGDQLDRGDDEDQILMLFESLREQAAAAGGAFIPLLGNHEIMNAAGDLRYVTPGGFEDFAHLHDALPREVEAPDGHHGRLAAFLPGGDWSGILAGHNVAVLVGDTVFVHGGILPQHVSYGLERINQETQTWLRGAGPLPPVLRGSDAPIWSRHYSDAPDQTDCALLAQTLEALGAARMVVGHTVQQSGITSACDDRVWRVDVGMAAHYGGSPQVLLLEGGTPRVLR